MLCPNWGINRIAINVPTLILRPGNQSGGWIDVSAVVWAGQTSSRQQIVRFYLFHPFVWRRGLLFYDAYPLTLAFGAAAILVIAGLYLVNRPDPAVIAPLLNVT